jgi:hypothetical protein
VTIVWILILLYAIAILAVVIDLVRQGGASWLGRLRATRPVSSRRRDENEAIATCALDDAFIGQLRAIQEATQRLDAEIKREEWKRAVARSSIQGERASDLTEPQRVATGVEEIRSGSGQVIRQARRGAVDYYHLDR